jgi:hypothetical protein
VVAGLALDLRHQRAAARPLEVVAFGAVADPAPHVRVDRRPVCGEQVRVQKPDALVLDPGQGGVERTHLPRGERSLEVARRELRRHRETAEHARELLGLAQRARLDPVLQHVADREPERDHHGQAQRAVPAQQ